MFNGEYIARRSGNLIEIEREGMFRTTPRITFSPEQDECTFTIKDVTIGIGFHWQRKEDQQFRGTLKLQLTDEGILAINRVSIEDYLASVISSEMSADASANLLQAHAIASRSWLLAQLGRSRELKSEHNTYATVVETEAERIRWYDREAHDLFDVCADDHCQRYQGITKAHTSTVSDAVQATFGMVLMHNGTVCDARFSKCCGGITELFENVWQPEQKPYLTSRRDTHLSHEQADVSAEPDAERWICSRPDVFCNTSDKRIITQILMKYDQETSDFFRWTVEYEQDELAAIVARRSGIDFGLIRDLVPVERGKSGRLTKLKIVGSKRTLTIGKELEIRRTLSNSHLYSSALSIQRLNVKAGVPSRFILHGAGWGHGVGMCQIGAAVMGDAGYTSDSILSHYFPKTERIQLYQG
ncbi:MAG: SpoIID/LytB domain-containing protein [Bacteroidetes bacterium]|nr:SpoIID/LytB domain-containing protein [Bacteroidota bacterium]MCW5895209.1 SpoIID/LytB domain-containing protein [Bacteroidota bacterium]